MVAAKTRLNSVWYREVCPKLIVAIRGCSKTPRHYPPKIFRASCAQFFKTGFFHTKNTLSALIGTLECLNAILRIHRDFELILFNFCRGVAGTKSARAHVGVLPQKGENRLFFAENT